MEHPKKPVYLWLKHIEPIYPNKPPEYTKETGHWIPPLYKEEFKLAPNLEWQCYRWTPGNLEPASQSQIDSLVEFQTTSIFWCSRRQGYILVPYDCTTMNVIDERRRDPRKDWKPLQFSHEEYGKRRCISLAYSYGEEWTVGAQVPGRWVSHLLPPTYHFHRDTQSKVDPPYSGDCQLGGDLSVLLGLITFAGKRQLAWNLIQTCFKPGAEWVAPNIPRRTYINDYERGIVVFVGYERGADDTHQYLKNLEKEAIIR